MTREEKILKLEKVIQPKINSLVIELSNGLKSQLKKSTIEYSNKISPFVVDDGNEYSEDDDLICFNGFQLEVAHLLLQIYKTSLTSLFETARSQNDIAIMKVAISNMFENVFKDDDHFNIVSENKNRTLH